HHSDDVAPVATPVEPSLATSPRIAPRVATDPALAAGAFSGHVWSSATKQGIANAQITFVSDAGEATSVDTDASGAFAIEPAAPGRYVIATVAATGYVTFAPEWGTTAMSLVARPGVRITDIALYLAPDVEIVASIVDSTNAAVAGASLSILDGASTDRFMTDDRGEVRFHAAANILVEARHPAFGVGRARVDVTTLMTRHLVIQLAPDASAPGRITGRVVDTAGAPVPASLVRAAHVEAGEMHPRRNTHGDDNGRFVLDGLDAGLHVVWVVCDDCASSRIRATTGDDVTLVVGAGVTIRGRVVEAADGKPVPAFSVQLARPRARRDVNLDERAIIDADGRFQFPGVPAGAFHVRVTAANHAPISVDVEVGTDPPPELVIRLSGGGTIRGSIVDRVTHAGVLGAVVSVDGTVDVGSPVMALGSVAVTDASGAFTLDDVPIGVRSIRAHAEGHHSAMLAGILVDDGSPVGPVELQLAPLADGERPQLDMCGIGARTELGGDAIVITEIVPDGGAQRAGLVVGDAIVAIDGRPTSELGSMQAGLDSLRGIEGTRVVVSIRRGDAGPLSDVSVERRAFRWAGAQP
ncbi:MAG TPA: carboxypeptidase regulatory-like domain-containing protein, partial [Kofleriaceae bacterium]|nr:carboxypeptidase regulatory-like domain-containing protein [Kofleriaceae bacterium]